MQYEFEAQHSSFAKGSQLIRTFCLWLVCERYKGQNIFRVGSQTTNGLSHIFFPLLQTARWIENQGRLGGNWKIVVQAAYVAFCLVREAKTYLLIAFEESVLLNVMWQAIVSVQRSNTSSVSVSMAIGGFIHTFFSDSIKPHAVVGKELAEKIVPDSNFLTLLYCNYWNINIFPST